MLKWIFLGLLVLNGAVLIANRASSEGPQVAFNKEVNPQSVALVARTAPVKPNAALPATAVPNPNLPPATPAQPPNPATAAAPAVDVSNSPCYAWEGFSGNYASNNAEKAIELAKLEGSRLERTHEGTRYWVYIPPLDSKEWVDKKLGELERKGLEGFFPIADGGRWRLAISMGIYSTEAEAQARLEALQAKGVRSAVMKPREDVPAYTAFMIKADTPEAKARLEKLARRFAGSALKRMACPTAATVQQ